MRTIESTIYQFDELSDRAKDKARDQYRQHVFTDSSDWEHMYEDFAQVADILGINLRTRQVKLMGGGTRMEPCIWWSGFSSQGDGACFEGTYYYAKGSAAKIREYAPQDETLHKIADTLRDIQRPYLYKLSANVTQSGHYNHEMCTDIDVEYLGDDVREVTNDAIEAIKDTLRDFMRWIYRSLEREHDYQMSDEVIDENIRANEYEFNEYGNME